MLGNGDETLGPPAGITIASGSDLISEGVGLAAQPATITLAIPAGVTVEQVLLYWQGRILPGEAGAGDDTIIVDTASIAPTEVTGDLIGSSPAPNRLPSFSYRADVTSLGLVSSGATNEVILSGVSFSFRNDGASLVVITDDGTSTSFIEILDGTDFAFIGSPGAANVTVPQTFNFPAAGGERTGELHILAGDGTPARPDLIEITIDGSLTSLCNELQGSDGPEWDDLTIPVTIPAGATSLTVQLFSTTCGGFLSQPDSLTWVVAALSIEDECAGRIGDFVFHDQDCDGLQDGGDEPLEAVMVTLLDSTGLEIASTSTNSVGFYEFTGLCAGDYTVEVETPAGFEPTTPLAGTDTAVDSNESPTLVTLSTDQSTDTTIDFGFIQLGSISGRVWLEDVDCDGVIQPGEPGLNGVTVELWTAAGTTQIDETVTSGGGNYSFQDLLGGDCGPPGGYLVVVDLTSAPLAGLTANFDIDGGQDARAIVVLGDGEDREDVDFSFCEEGGGGEGCTPGYWKQKHHFDSWPAPYTPSTKFSDVFNNAFPGKTLLAVLKLRGGGLNALGRHTVAALLNAASGGVSFDLSAGEVIDAFNDAFPGSASSYESLKNMFDRLNNQGCPLN